MLRSALLLCLLAGVALANWGRGSWDRFNDEDDDVKPPNCSCSSWRKNETEDEQSALRNERWVTKQLRAGETVEQFRENARKRHMVCGTDGVTYTNKCEFVNNATTNPTLGKRCRGPCPCDLTEEEEKEMPRHHDWKMPVCLNNGQTVYGYQAVREAVKADQSVGMRCWGECSDCSTELRCPKSWRRQHHRRESNATAPDCTCTLSSSPWFQEILNTTCGKKLLEKRQVCGSDGVTYESKCALKNKQAVSPTLGKRCRGPCPCTFERRERHHWESKKHGRFNRYRFPKAMCLNNGSTVYGWEEAVDALKADSSLGVRCKGECSKCQNEAIKCPLDWVKVKEEEDKNRPKPPNCKCPKALRLGPGRNHRKEICGNDNKTYANVCELINNQVDQPTLGFRCLGKCPCKNRTDDSTRTPKILLDENDEDRDDLDSPDQERPAGGAFQNEEEDHSENEDAPQDDRVKDKEGGSDESVDRPRPHPRPRPRPRPHRRFPICLTNNVTVRGWRNISQAFQNDSSVGIRCMGKCEWCAENLKCPRLPSEAEQQKIKERIMKRMQKFGERWMKMTVESPNKPGDCSCEFKQEKGEGMRFRRHKHHNMDWSVCGNNNVTFDNMCGLVNAQSASKNLGFRCHGKCPCPEDEFDATEDAEDTNSTIGQNFQKYLNETGKKFAFCLTNGQTVYNVKDLRRALASDFKLGTRYMDECSTDDSGLKCPRVFRPQPDGESMMGGEEKRWGRHGKGRRFGPKFGGDDHDFKRHGFGKGDWRKKMDEGERAEMWEVIKESPLFEYLKAKDFGFEGPMGGPMGGRWGGRHGGWKRHHRGNWFDCEAENNSTTPSE
ncbi:hypothetical protein RvY_07876 [Ramazzottius varieornatus]|uniref:Kazal-like domain-containing protein n=1 Tax=Ramazzottius varieornatus TaxID=947166 RepID=A0A1D1V9Q9_RAMVA|nr:hypothetical protein RvY_07876 [Ramazzottius varieornatus]